MFNLAAIRLRTTARMAARGGNWLVAADAYRAYLRRRPGDAGAWVQYGHAAKETGDLRTAATAYQRALALAPDAAEIWVHVSHVHRRLGDRTAAVECCVRAVALDAGLAHELVALGARDHLPPAMTAVGGPETDGLAVPELSAGAVYAPSRYGEFRRELVIAAPPRGQSLDRAMLVLIDARTALPVDVRATLSSLLDQIDERWNAIVHAPPAIRDHSVASLAAIDRRVRFAATDAVLPRIEDARDVLLIAAGTVLDRQTVAWFSYAAARTGSVAAYCDHDQAVDDWRAGRTFARPVFHPVFDPDWFSHPDAAPLAILVDRARLPLADWRQEDACRMIKEAAAIGPVAQLPLLLASRKMLAAQAEQAPLDPPAPAPDPRPAQAMPRKLNESLAGQRIQVVIQTRDQSAMLRTAIRSLHKQAARPDLLDVTIVDNRSTEPATERLIEQLRRRGQATSMTLDEPFNWSRANNLAVETGTAPLILFLNNDTETVTVAWDELLRDALSPGDVGIVGATLLYPDRSIQHAGIVMGIGRGGPIHEGVGRALEAGPNDRWRRSRSTAAVTGAFLAIRRDVHAAVGGFDAARFAIAFNDVDLCLRVRATGRRIVMASEIQVIHHESKTRGMNVSRSQVAWDLDELGALHDRWGPALFDDPAYNPHWTRTGQPFDGYRFPSKREILRHIDLSARATPWVPVTEAEEPVWW